MSEFHPHVFAFSGSSLGLEDQKTTNLEPEISETQERSFELELAHQMEILTDYPDRLEQLQTFALKRPPAATRATAQEVSASFSNLRQRNGE